MQKLAARSSGADVFGIFLNLFRPFSAREAPKADEFGPGTVAIVPAMLFLCPVARGEP